MQVLSSHGSRPLASCGKWSPFRGLYATRWRRRPPDCKYKQGTGLCTFTVCEEISILPESKHVLLILMLLFCHDVVLCSYEIVFVQLIFTSQQCRMSECEGHYLAIHPFRGFCAARKKGPDPYCISWAIVSKEHPDKQVAALMWAPHRPDTPNLKLPSSPGIILYCFPH